MLSELEKRSFVDEQPRFLIREKGKNDNEVRGETSLRRKPVRGYGCCEGNNQIAVDTST